MNEQQVQEMIHYLSTLTNYAMLMNDKLERFLEVAEANKSFKTRIVVNRRKQLPIYAAICEKMQTHSNRDRDKIIDICGKLLTDKTTRFNPVHWDSLESKFTVSTQLEEIIYRETNLGPSTSKAHDNSGYQRNTIGHQLSLLWDYLTIAAHGVDQYLSYHIKHDQEIPKQRWKHRVSWHRFYMDLALGIPNTNQDWHTNRNRDLKHLLLLLGRAYVSHQYNSHYSDGSWRDSIKEPGPHLLVVNASTGHPIITKTCKLLTSGILPGAQTCHKRGRA